MKQAIKNNFTRQFLGLAIAGLMVIFAVGCQRTNNPANGNTAANSNSANSNPANSNTVAAKSIKDELLGTWIQQESGIAKVKMVITKDEMTKFENDKKDDTFQYTWLNDKEIEVVLKGQKIPVKVTMAGDEMTQDMMNMAVKYKRESGNTANNASPSSETSKIEQKANAIVGKWETTTALDDKIAFDFSQPKKESEIYVGTYVFDVNGSKDPSAKYVVSNDKMIKFFDEQSKVYPLIKVSISDEGQSLSYYDQKGGTTKLTKVGSQASKQTDSADKEKGDCTVKADNIEFFIEATEKTVKLKKGTSLQYIMFGNQGLALVKAQIDGKWVRGEILLDNTTCN